MPAPPARSLSASVPCGLNSSSSSPARNCRSNSLFSPTYDEIILRICRVASSWPRPKPSTPALLEITVRPDTPESRSAAISASGMPHRPKPPTARVWPSATTPRSAAAAPSCTFPRTGAGRDRSVTVMKALRIGGKPEFIAAVARTDTSIRALSAWPTGGFSRSLLAQSRLAPARRTTCRLAVPRVALRSTLAARRVRNEEQDHHATGLDQNRRPFVLRLHRAGLRHEHRSRILLRLGNASPAQVQSRGSIGRPFRPLRFLRQRLPVLVSRALRRTRGGRRGRAAGSLPRAHPSASPHQASRRRVSAR